METWNLFSNSDAFYVIMGAAGLVSVIIVMRTAFANTNKFERKLQTYGQRQDAGGNLHEGGTEVPAGPDDQGPSSMV